MNKQDIVAFFDCLAPQWDQDLERPQAVLEEILDTAGVTVGKKVLDVACGTGVLFPEYLKRGVQELTAIDISPEMVRVAREKFPQVRVLCGDVEEYPLPGGYDCIMVYNAFPHFPDPEGLIRVLSALLAPGGTLTVAHGSSRASIDHHHEGYASKVSRGLLHEDALGAIFGKYLTVTAKISDDRHYQVTGRK